MSLQPINVVSRPHSSVDHVRTSLRAAEARKFGQSSSHANHAGKPEVAVIAAENKDASPRASGDGEARGVIRLLEEGHFKGVADVRLRINFFDELSSRANAAAGPVVEEQSHQLVAAVEAQVDELIGTLDVEDETQESITAMVEDFDAAVQAAVRDTLDAGVIDADTLAGQIASLFNEFFGRLQDLLAEPIPEPAPPPEADAVADTISSDSVDDVPDDPDVEPPDDTGDGIDAPPISYEEMLGSLQAVFDDAISTLLASISSALQLSDPSPPSGHGVAYEKFLDIYNELRGVTSSIDDTA